MDNGDYEGQIENVLKDVVNAPDPETMREICQNPRIIKIPEKRKRVPLTLVMLLTLTIIAGLWSIRNLWLGMAGV